MEPRVSWTPQHRPPRYCSSRSVSLLLVFPIPGANWELSWRNFLAETQRNTRAVAWKRNFPPGFATPNVGLSKEERLLSKTMLLSNTTRRCISMLSRPPDPLGWVIRPQTLDMLAGLPRQSLRRETKQSENERGPMNIISATTMPPMPPDERCPSDSSPVCCPCDGPPPSDVTSVTSVTRYRFFVFMSARSWSLKAFPIRMARSSSILSSAITTWI